MGKDERLEPLGEERSVTPVRVEQRRNRHQVIGDGLAWTATWSLRWILIAAGAVLIGLIVRETWSILLPVLLALIVTSVLQPAALLLERKLGLSTTLAAATVMIGFLVALVGIGYAITQSIVGQADDIAKDATSGLQKIQDWVQSSNMVTEDQLDTAIQGLQDRITDSASNIASGVVVGVGAVGSAVITMVVTLILTFLFLKNGRRFRPWLAGLAGHRVGPHLREVLGQSWDTLGGFIRTQALVAFIDAVLIGIGLVIVGVPLAVPLAILTFFGGFIPIVGAIVVGALAVLVALVSVSVTGALIVLAIIVAVQQIEGNVLQPWLQSRTMQLDAAVVLLAITLGSTLFGIIGAFLAVPATAVAAGVLRYLNQLVSETSAPVTSANPPDEPKRDPDPVSEAQQTEAEDAPTAE
jgi:predicted PurR-regulated permease PerM